MVILALGLLALVPGAGEARPAAKGQVRSFTGTVSAVSRDHHVFRIRRSGHASVRIRVTRATKLARGTRLKRGQALGVRARKGHHGWVASRIARSRAGAVEDPAAGDDDPGAEDEDPGADDEDLGFDNDPGDDGGGDDDPSGGEDDRSGD